MAMSLNAKTKADEAMLIADLKATFPGLKVESIAGQIGSHCHIGARVRGEAEMPDDLPIFSTLYFGEDEYNGYVHAGFSAWLEARGWYVEVYDLGVLDIEPLRRVAIAVDQLKAAWFPRAQAPIQPGELPF